jgi:hypothetical protein
MFFFAKEVMGEGEGSLRLIRRAKASGIGQHWSASKFMGEREWSALDRLSVQRHKREGEDTLL